MRIENSQRNTENRNYGRNGTLLGLNKPFSHLTFLICKTHAMEGRCVSVIILFLSVVSSDDTRFDNLQHPGNSTIIFWVNWLWWGGDRYLFFVVVGFGAVWISWLPRCWLTAWSLASKCGNWWSRLTSQVGSWAESSPIASSRDQWRSNIVKSLICSLFLNLTQVEGAST